MTERRGFLKIGASILGALTLFKYTEPVVAMADTHRDWIEDKGDYCIIRVPDFKTFAKEIISKPAIFILGEKAVVSDVDVSGFVNIYAPKGGLLTKSRVDARHMMVERDRPVINLKAENMDFIDCYFVGTGVSPSIGFPDYTGPMRTVSLLH